MADLLWIEIELSLSGPDVLVTALGSKGERLPAAPLGVGLERLEAFTRTVARAVAAGRSLSAADRDEARALYQALFRADIVGLASRYLAVAPGERVLVRLMIRDRALQSVPWEALCRPETARGFLAGAPDLLVARGVSSSRGWTPRKVSGAVRVLAVAPTASDAPAVAALRSALDGPIAAHAVEWLDPLVGPPAASKRLLFQRLGDPPAPTVPLVLGHGGLDAAGEPTLRLADDQDGEEVWISAEDVAGQLAAAAARELHLVILEACEGARPAVFGSAAELFARAGADAVVAHLWPVRADAARSCSAALYHALTMPGGHAAGDIASSLGGARRALLTDSAEGFSPVLYLRALGTQLFDFGTSFIEAPVAPPANPPPVAPPPAPAPFRFFSAERLEQIRGAAVSVGFARTRSALLSGLSPGWVDELETDPRPAAQLKLDLEAMNRTERLADGSVPMEVWLATAAALAELQREAAVFRDALAELRAR